MGDDDADAGEPPQRLHEPGARRDVEVVRRFVEEEHVRGAGEDEGAADLPAHALARREHGPARQVGGVEAEAIAEAGRRAIPRRGERLHRSSGDSIRCGQR